MIISAAGAIVTAIVTFVGFCLWDEMRTENKRTRPARVRQRLKELGLTDEQIDSAQSKAPLK